jgi:diguanylate cyclase (GGDEF)-like protein/PAS domain S-box-containing protein
MGLVVHAAMLVAMLLLPYPQNIQVIKSIALPVMLIYPIGSVILGLLLLRQRDFRQNQKQLIQSEKRYQALFNDAPLPYQSLDENGRIIDVNTQWLEMMGYESKSEVIGTKFHNFLDEDWKIGFEERFIEFKRSGRIVVELTMLKKDGKGIHVLEEGRINYKPDGEFLNTHCIIKDVTDQKKAEEKLVFISYHDYLTGLYNRRYFENELNKYDKKQFLPISIVMGDINGLKLINDTLGHSYGDTLIIDTAEILKKSIKDEYILSRTGGDEFTILMPNTSGTEAAELITRVLELSQEYNLQEREDVISINLSLGAATKEKQDQPIAEVIRNAEYNMYQRKLLEKKSSHSSIISSMQATMIEKSHETEAHARRLSNMTRKIGLVMGLPQHELDQLELLAMLHDIGKVAVPENILNKPGKLSQEEWKEMKKHPEVGYRIASSSPDLVSIAEYILCHHERWDGKGYPQGIEGKNIPLLSRILSVVDAYDAMTEDRAYRKAMGKFQAINEIAANSGTQFDPEIAGLFIDKVLNKEGYLSID